MPAKGISPLSVNWVSPWLYVAGDLAKMGSGGNVRRELLKVTGDLSTQGQVCVDEYEAGYIAGNEERERRRMDLDPDRNGGYGRVEGLEKLIGLSI